jgi:hypothetical protein
MDSNDGDVTNQMYAELHVMCLYFCSVFKESWIYSTAVKTFPIWNVTETRLSVSGDETRKGNDRHEEANRAYRKFVKAPDNAT